MTQRTRTVLCVAMIALSVPLLARALYRGGTSAMDLAYLHTSTRTWLAGENPYDWRQNSDRFARTIAPQTPTRAPDTFFTLYPPALFPILTPIAAVDWPQVRWVMAGLQVGALGLLIWAFCRLFPHAPPLALAAVVLLWAPVHTSIAMGQLPLIAWALFCGGLVATKHDRRVLAGVCLGLSVAIKPQMCGLALMAFAFLGQWRIFLVATAVGLTCLGVGIAQLAIHGHAWTDLLRETIHAFEHGGTGDPTLHAHNRHLRIDLQVLLHTLIEPRAAVKALSWLIVLAGVAVALWRGVPRARAAGPTSPAAMRLLATLLVWSALPTYHRFYDLVTLTLAAAVLWWQVGPAAPRLRWPGFVLVAWLFVVNSGAALNEAVEPRVSSGVTQTIAWQLFAVPHQTWLLLALAVVMTVWPWPDRREPASGEAPGVETLEKLGKKNRTPAT